MSMLNSNRCFRLLMLVAAIWLVGSMSNYCVAQQRTWTDASGSYSVEGTLIDVTESEDGLKAQLETADGKRMAILLSLLCEADQAVAKTFLAESKVEAAQPESPVKVAPVTTETEEPEKLKKDTETRSKLPEDSILSRPLSPPVGKAYGKLDNRNLMAINFDPKTAIRLDREIVRDEKGRPVENPAYLVEVTERQLSFLPANVRKLVDQLNDPTVAVDVRRRAIESLKDSWPQGRQPGLLNVLINTLSDKDKFLRVAALDLLANHDSDQSLIYILARIDDTSFDVRWRTFEILSQLRDPRVIPELCERLDGVDRVKAASALQAFGEIATQWVHPWLETEDNESVLLNACQLLGKIGGTESLEQLEKLKDHQSLLVRSQTENSIKQIQKRLAERASNPPKRR